MASSQKSFVKSIHGNRIVAVGILLYTCSSTRRLNTTLYLYDQSEHCLAEQKIVRPSLLSWPGGGNWGVPDALPSWMPTSSYWSKGEDDDAGKSYNNVKKRSNRFSFMDFRSTFEKLVDEQLLLCPANQGVNLTEVMEDAKEVAKANAKAGRDAAELARSRRSDLGRRHRKATLTFSDSDFNRSSMSSGLLETSQQTSGASTLHVFEAVLGPDQIDTIQEDLDKSAKSFLGSISKDQKAHCAEQYDRAEVFAAFSYTRADKVTCEMQFKTFYHGTTHESAMAIITDGLSDMRRGEGNPDKGLMLGNGFYLADSISKADQYAVPNNEEVYSNRIVLFTILQFQVASYIVNEAVKVLAWRSRDREDHDAFESMILSDETKTLFTDKTQLLAALRSKHKGRMIHLLAKELHEEEYEDAEQFHFEGGRNLAHALVQALDEYVIPVELMEMQKQAHIRPSVLISYRRCSYKGNYFKGTQMTCIDVGPRCST